MGGAIEVEREDMSVQESRQLAGRVSRRLLAIAMVLEGMRRKIAAESCGMDHQTLRDWVYRYNAEGIEGLGNRRRDGVKLRLTSDQMTQLATWVEHGPDPKRDGVTRWLRVDLARLIKVVVDGQLVTLAHRRLDHATITPRSRALLNKYGGEAVFTAVRDNDIYVRGWLTVHGIDVSVKNDTGVSPMYVAALGNGVAALEW